MSDLVDEQMVNKEYDDSTCDKLDTCVMDYLLIRDVSSDTVIINQRG